MTKRLVQGPASPVWLVDANGEPVDATHGLPIGDGWEVLTGQDTTANDNDKSFGVPAGYWWQILSIRVVFVSDATVGNRQLAVQLVDNAGTIMDEVRVGATQAASLTYYYELGPSLADLTAVRDSDWLMTPIPPTWLLQPLHHLRVLDRNNISATDDMSVYYRYARKVI